MDDQQHDGSALRRHARVVQRRKWIMLQFALLVPLAAVFLSLTQQHLYRSSADVFLNRNDLAASLTGIQDPNVYQDPSRAAQTQVDLARVPGLAARTLQAAGVRHLTRKAFLDQSDVAARPNSDLLEFHVTDPQPARAKRLATEYARQFTIYRRALDTAALTRAENDVRARIERLDSLGRQSSPLYTSLLDKEQQLQTIETLGTSNAVLVRPADDALQIQPRPVRNGILGLVGGLILGLAFAFLWEAFDTRVRSAEEISERLGLPLLARISEPSRRLRRKNLLVMVAQPNDMQAEGFRTLMTNVEFTNLERNARTIMVTSAIEQEGKSTTVANLAVAMARSGRRVALVDLDLRRPILDRFFDLKGRAGLTDIALGNVDLEEAISRIAIAELKQPGSVRENGRNPRGVQGILEVLVSGQVPPDPGEFIGTHALGSILGDVRERAELVLIDSPPLLRVNDALQLSGIVDAVIVITSMKIIRRPMLGELRRILDTMPAAKFGFVLTGAEVDEGYGYGVYYHYEARKRSERERIA